MKHVVNSAIVAAILVLLIISCAPVVSPDADPAALEKGTLVIGIKSLFSEPTEPPEPVKPAAQKTLSTGVSGPSMAIACISHFTIKVIDSMDQVILSQDFATSNTMQDVEVPPGTYTVTVDIYNTAVSATVPVVHGSTSGVIVTSNVTAWINIVCLPTSTTALTDGVWTTSASFTHLNYGTNGTTSGTEKWYAFVPTNGALRMSTNATCYVRYGIFDADGSWVVSDTFYSSGMNSLAMAATPGETYYIALANASVADGSIAVMLESIDPVSVTGVSFDSDSLTMNFGELVFPGYTISPADATTPDVILSSSDEAIVTADPWGVQGVGEGTATVTITTIDGGFTDTIDITVGAPVFKSWISAALAGGVDSAHAVQIPSLDTWYTGSVADDGSVWYYVSVNTANTYDFYWDDSYSGSGVYSSDLQVRFYHADGTTLYADEDSGYFIPSTITPAEGTIIIEVDGYYNGGTYAIGVHQQ